MFEICQVVLSLIKLLLDHFDLQKKNYGRIEWISIIKSEYSKYPIPHKTKVLKLWGDIMDFYN